MAVMKGAGFFIGMQKIASRLGFTVPRFCCNGHIFSKFLCSDYIFRTWGIFGKKIGRARIPQGGKNNTLSLFFI